MSLVNTVLRALVDGLLYPFRSLPPVVGLTVVSLLAAVGMLVVFKRTSNQSSLERVKGSIHACLFEMRLFSDDLRAIMRAQFEILGHNLRYLGLTIVPMLWMIIPLALLVAQLQFHYGYQPLAPGAKAVVKAQLTSAAADGVTRPDLQLEVPQGLTVETPGVWVPAEREMDWRIAADAPGDYQVTVRSADGTTATKDVQVGHSAIRRRSPVRPDKNLWEQLVYPAEAPLGGGPFQALSVSYPGATVWLLGWHTHWMVVFFILTIVFAFALRKPMKVTI